MSELRVVTEELGGSPISRLAQRGELPAWYPARPGDAVAWRDRLRDVAASSPASWLEALRPALAAGGGAAARLERVAREGGAVITTGQQPGLFGGPLLTLAKALTALALSDELEAATGIPVAPIFWAATDDSDLAECNWTAVALTGGVVKLRAPGTAPEGTPMSGVPLGEIRGALATLTEAAGSAADAGLLDRVGAAYRPDATIGGAYVTLLRGVLEPLGIAVLDASHPATRRAAEPVLRRALARAEAVERCLEERAAEIAAAGHAVQVEPVAGLSLVFSSEGGVRRRLPVREALERGGEIAADALSPNVLLRPIVERSIVPTAAYVAGPGEIAYFAQIAPIADTLGVATPLAVPRWSGTILEPRIERLLARLGVAREELATPDAVETRLARLAVPEPLRVGVEQLRDQLARVLTALAAHDPVELVPRASLEGLGRRIGHQISRLERRYAAAVKRRETQLMLDVATARGALYPDGVRQERVLGWAAYLARYGGAVTDGMLAEARRHAAALVGGVPSLGSGRAAERASA